MVKPPCLRENTDHAPPLRYTLSFAIHLRKITGKISPQMKLAPIPTDKAVG